LFFLLLLLMLNSCSSMDKRVYDQSAIEAIKNWHLDFTFQSREDMNIERSTGETEQRSTQKGYGKKDLQFLDDLYYALKDDHGLNLVKDKQKADGLLLLHIIFYESGVPNYVTITFSDTSEKVLSRVKLFNKYSKNTLKVNRRVLNDTSKAISNILRNKKGGII